MRDALAELPIPPRLLGATLVVLCLLMAPHAANLSPAVLGFFYAAAAWRLAAMLRPRLMPGRWLLLLLMVAAIGLVGFTTVLQDGRLAGTALLVVMLGLKLLELRARRDIHVTVFLGYFLVLSEFLYDQSLGLALYLFSGVGVLATIQLGLNRVHADMRREMRSALMLLAAAAPLALVLFLVFPRLQTPLWGINAQGAVTGISGEMTLGNIGELSRSNATAFRVRFLDTVPPPEARYWRGPVLWDTDGRNWSAGRRPVRTIEPPDQAGAPVAYEVTLEPTGEYWLFGLDVVTAKPPETYLNSNFTLVGEQRVNRRLTYRAGSDPGFRIDTLSTREAQRGLALPEALSPRVVDLVRDWQREVAEGGPLRIVERALRFFREQPFVYTLSPGTLRGDPVEQFLFETRRGFCEHYAGSFALLMRIAGIPSRVVIGYQGGEKNPHADHWVIRQSDAHAWTEVWLPELGWWRVDPTAAVAPQRVERPIDSALSADADRVVFDSGDRGMLRALWSNAAWIADAVDLGWHRWVVGFTAERQQSLLQMFGLERLRGFGVAVALLIGGGLAVGLVYLLARLPRRPSRDRLPLLWQRFTTKLARAGVAVEPWQGPDTVCATAGRCHPDAREQIAAINRLYVQLRYGKHCDERQVDALRRRIRRLRL